MDPVIRILAFCTACTSLWASLRWWRDARHEMLRGQLQFARAFAMLALVLDLLGGVLLARAVLP